MSEGPILFFDGECSFCSYWVSFVLAREKAPELRFCASQSPNAKRWLSEADLRGAQSTVLLLENGRLYRKSTAALRVLRRLRGYAWLGYLGSLVPRPVRDAVYDRIAANRRRLPLKCELPADRSRFLD